jgi:hypothetical protein
VHKTLVDAIVFAQNAVLKGKREMQENRETLRASTTHGRCYARDLNKGKTPCNAR